MDQEKYEHIVCYITANQEKFYRLAFSYAHNRDDALDIVQSAVCKALCHCEALRDRNAVRTWFYRILVNESIKLISRRSREIPSEDGGWGNITYNEPGFEAGTDLYEQINRLEVDVQTIIKLRFYEELELKEIAAVTNLNLNTVKAKLYRGLKQLRRNIQEVDT